LRYGTKEGRNENAKKVLDFIARLHSGKEFTLRFGVAKAA